ncbi:MAG: hypothetical protein ACI4RI_03105, partial [Ruminococcus sp.]
MKQYIAFIVTAVILFASVFTSATFEMKTDRLVDSQKVKQEKSYTYYLRDYQGRLAVFRESKNDPIITTDTMVNTLPVEDQKKLKTGVEVKGDVSLRKALED